MREIDEPGWDLECAEEKLTGYLEEMSDLEMETWVRNIPWHIRTRLHTAVDVVWNKP